MPFAAPVHSVASAKLEYLLLDDLYELLEEPDDLDNRSSILTTIDFLLDRRRRELESDGMGEKEEIEHLRLVSELQQLKSAMQASTRLPRSKTESVRDAVLVWITRVQKQQRALVKESDANHDGDDSFSSPFVRFLHADSWTS
jgi:hypothetical protein